MPKHPVYVAMLPESARKVIGLHPPSGRAAMRMLEYYVFIYDCYVDIFDGGPTMTARTDDVASIRDAVAAKVGGTELATGEKALVATNGLADFRCCYGFRELTDGSVAIDSASARLLKTGEGNELWSVAR
jgi:arginine N-succinyltransferase